MSQLVLEREDDELGYEVDARFVSGVLSERRGVAMSRQLNGRERHSQQSRYNRRPAPTRMSGSHRRRNKHHGM